MYVSILKCGPGLLFIGLSSPSVQVELEMPAVESRPVAFNLGYVYPGGTQRQAYG
jgi:hypothetical protein